MSKPDEAVRDSDPALYIAQVRAFVAGIDADGMSAAEIEEALEARQAEIDATKPWFYPGTDDAHSSAAAVVEIARAVETSAPFGDALYDVLANAASHLPEFTGSAVRPWGCSTCGTADGTGACDTWLSGIALAKSLAADVTVEYGRQITESSADTHLVGHVSSTYSTREDAIHGGNGLGLHTDQRIVRRYVTPWVADEAAEPHGPAASEVPTPTPGSAMDAALVRYVTSRGIAMPFYTSGSKITEEAQELVDAIASGDRAHIMEEVADVSITAAVAARQFGFTVEEALEVKIARDTGRGEKR